MKKTSRHKGIDFKIKVIVNGLAMSVFALTLQGCGVKGDPLPPERPVEIGRGKPTYKRAFRNIQIDGVNSTKEADSAEKEEKNGP